MFYVVFKLQAAASLSGIHTEVVYTDFDDRMFIMITQYNKVGTVVSILGFGVCIKLFYSTTNRNFLDFLMAVISNLDNRWHPFGDINCFCH